MGTDVKAYLRLNEAGELFRKGLKDQASMKVIEHLREHRDEPRGLALLGRIAMDGGALVQAEQFLRRAYERGEQSVEVKRNLASVILSQDRLDEALVAYGELERDIGDIPSMAARAMILGRLGRSEESIAVYQEIIGRADAEAIHWITYGHGLRFAGRTDEAIAAYRRVVDQDPERGEAWWGLADIKSRVLTDEDMRTMEEALADAVDVLNIVPLHMALARGFDDRGEYERAFAHYREGNRLRAELIRYDPRELTSEVDQFIRTISPENAARSSDVNGPTPVFLISLPRSGSTLLEQILDSHPKIEATGELPYVRALMRASLEMHMRRAPITVPEYIARLSPEEKRDLGAEYLRRAAQHRRTDAPFFIDKMPSNWADVFFIREILPQARFIEIRRNAMDCCFSNYVHHFGSAHAASFDLVNQARACVDYTRLMDHLNAAAPNFLCSIRYETLIEQPEAELRRALDYLGLDWTDDLLRFYESDRVIRTPSAEQVRRPLNRSGIGRWKPYAEWLGPMRDTLGPLADA
jgi:tetratricopeptide (TPR) repeat protein